MNNTEKDNLQLYISFNNIIEESKQERKIIFGIYTNSIFKEKTDFQYFISRKYIYINKKYHQLIEQADKLTKLFKK